MEASCAFIARKPQCGTDERFSDCSPNRYASNLVLHSGYVLFIAAPACQYRACLGRESEPRHVGRSGRRGVRVRNPKTKGAKVKGAPTARGIRLAADIGGTFTDVAVFDERTGRL